MPEPVSREIQDPSWKPGVNLKATVRLTGDTAQTPALAGMLAFSNLMVLTSS